MRRFYIITQNESGDPRRIDFHAESPDHAFQIARNEEEGIHIELWQDETLLARMTKSGANIWKLLPTVRAGDGDIAHRHTSAVSA